MCTALLFVVCDGIVAVIFLHCLVMQLLFSLKVGSRDGFSPIAK